MFLQDSKEGRKREHINNICARERKGPEGKLVRVSIRGKKEGKKTPREKTPMGKIQTGAGKGAAGKKPVCLFVITAVHPDSLYFQIEQNSLFTHQWQAGRKKRNRKRTCHTQPRR